MKKVLLFGACVALFACSNNEKETNKEVPSEVESTDQKEDEKNEGFADFKFHSIIANLPAPIESMKDLVQDGAEYDEALLCPKGNAMNHTTTTAKALNCGIYMVDLTYLASFHQSHLMPSYLGTAHKLAEEVDAGYAFDTVLNERLEKSLDNKDSLMKLMDDGLEAMEEFLGKNNRLVTATQLLTGGWIETQYITTSSLLKLENPTEHLKGHVFEQRTHLENLLKLMHEFKDDAGLHDELDKLQKLEASFLKIHDANEVTHEILVELTEEIKEIRNDIIAM